LLANVLASDVFRIFEILLPHLPMIDKLKQKFIHACKMKPLHSLVFIGLIMVVVSSNIHWGQDHWKNMIEADAKGYYAYLPAVFIYEDLNFGFFDKIEKETYYNPQWFYDYRSYAHGKVINKYYCGTALCQLPFFGIAHVLSPMMGLPQDGYSKLYMIMINVAAIVYLMLGLFFADKTLKMLNFSVVTRVTVMLAFSLGTNLFYYTMGECGMSHVYSFALVSMFVYFVQAFFRDGKWVYVNLAIALAGLIVLVRPVNGLVLFALFFLAGNPSVARERVMLVLGHFYKIIPGLLVGLGFPLLQLVVYKASTAHFFVYSYVNEGFDFSNPQIFNFLISYKKGMFVYTPLLLVSLFGVYVMAKKSLYQGLSFVLFLFTVVYVLASWWNWWYGGSFGSRVMIEYYIFFMISLAYFIDSVVGKFGKLLALGLIVGLVLFTQIQTYQYRYYKIHWDQQDHERYWKEFMRIDNL
jgi:hypothetical protein